MFRGSRMFMNYLSTLLYSSHRYVHMSLLIHNIGSLLLMCCKSLRPSFKCQFHRVVPSFISFASYFLWPTKTFETLKDYLFDKLNDDLFNRKI